MKKEHFRILIVLHIFYEKNVQIVRIVIEISKRK